MPETAETVEASDAAESNGLETTDGDDQAASNESELASSVDETSASSDQASDGVAALLDPSLIDDTPDVAEEITVTALSGEAMPLTPPQLTGPTDPGALGRWFAQASGPVEAPLTQSNDLLTKLATQTSQQALSGGQKTSGEGIMSPANALGQDTEAYFANALASSGLDGTTSAEGATASKPGSVNATTADVMASKAPTAMTINAENFDAFVTQAMAKSTAALEPGSTNAPTLTTGQTMATGAQSAMTAVPQTATGQAVPVTALAVEINRQAMNGKTQFDIRLDPPELGRLNVRLEMDANGQTRTHMIVERAETLDMLSTDARNLERALQQAGLKTEPGSVTFELAQDAADGFAQDQQSANADDQSSDSGSSENASPTADDPLLAETLTSPEAIRQQLYVTGHLDVHI